MTDKVDRLEEMLSTLIIMLGNAKNEQCKMREEITVLRKKVDLIEKREFILTRK